jgi:Sec-independent protein translocase protein TatA
MTQDPHIDPVSSEDVPGQPDKKKTAVDALNTAKNAADTAKTIAEGTGNAISAIKWVAIAIVALVIFGSGLAIYKMISAPAKAVGKATEAVTETVKSRASSMADGTTDLINRLVVPTANQADLNNLSEAAFSVLSNLVETPPEGMKERLYWTANLAGHENRVCELSIAFGGEPVSVLIAADNKAYAAAKALGSKNDRLIRMVLRAPGDDVPFNVEWDNETVQWVTKWRATTVKKPLEDEVADVRVREVLQSAARGCGIN